LNVLNIRSDLAHRQTDRHAWPADDR